MSKLNKPRLGRGLSSLISMESTDDTQPKFPTDQAHHERAVLPPTVPHINSETITLMERVLDVPIENVKANPHQPRRQFDESSLLELAASLKTNGLIQPIVARQVGSTFELIAGERRLKAAKLAGMTSIAVIVKEVDGLSQAQMALVENIQRENLNPIDRAQAYRTLLGQLGLSHAELAARLGEERSTISNHLRLLDLPASVHDWVRSEHLSLGHAKVLAGVSDILEQEQLAQLVVSENLSVRGLEKVIAEKTPVRLEENVPTKPSAHIRELEGALSTHLGAKVSIRASKKDKGKLVISYTSLDQFDDLVAKLGVRLQREL